MNYRYEGVECYVKTAPAQNYIPVYRSFRGQTDHFYTTNKKEYNKLPKTYKKEGIEFYLSGIQLGGYVPLYRLYNSKRTDHFYCTAIEEVQEAEKNGYKLEGVLGYVLKKEDPYNLPLYRAYNIEKVDHFYTVDILEIDDSAPKISDLDLAELLEKELEPYISKKVKLTICTSDAMYFCPTLKVVKEIIENAKIDQMQYISEISDCDDFTLLLKSAFIIDAYDGGKRSLPYAFGMVWGKGHALNVVVTSDNNKFEVRIVEPQTGLVHLPEDEEITGINLMVF